MANMLALPGNLPESFRGMMSTLEEVAVADDALSASIQIAAGILDADSEEAIFDASDADTTSMEEFSGRPFRVVHNRVSFRKSADQYSDDGGFPYYALVRTWDETGAEMVLNLGGVSVVPTLFALWDKGHIQKYGEEGMTLVLTTQQTGGGWTLFKLRKYAGKKA